MPRAFPHVEIGNPEDANPAVRLFGRRFFSEQAVPELLTEFMLVASSPKRFGNTKFDSCLPTNETWDQESKHSLEYGPRARLNLKLFSFLGASRLETRHETHRAHLRELDEAIAARVRVSGNNRLEVLHTLENLFLGFHGCGLQRTWCAHSFLPVCTGVLTAETLWNETYAKKNPPDTWEQVVSQYKSYFSVNRHRFLARGGEVLYLQLCNALRTTRASLMQWIETDGLTAYLTPQELDPSWLRDQLEDALQKLVNSAPRSLEGLANFVDNVAESETAKATDGVESMPHWSECGWCPQESWKEGYLFAVELLRVCRANLDPIERIQMLETLCAMQLIRSLASQAARYVPNANVELVPPYRIGVSALDEDDRTVKQVSQETIRTLSKMIYDALRAPEIADSASLGSSLYKQADNQYGHKLLVAVCRRIGLIVPQRGMARRFVLPQRVLRLLLVVLCPKRYLSYETLKLAAKAHYGLAFDEDGLREANQWATGVAIESFGRTTDEWFMKMLEEAGALRRLSDSCALVENRAAPTKENQA